MSFTVDWYIVGRIIKVQIAGDVTLSELEAISGQLVALLDASTAPLVHILGDLGSMSTQSSYMPRQLKELQRLGQPHLAHPCCGWVLLYGMSNPLVGFVTNTIMQLARVRTRTVSSEAAALAFLREQDESLHGVIETE